MNSHPSVYRTALVGTGPIGLQQPVLVVEPWEQQRPRQPEAEAALLEELRQWAKSHEQTATVEDIRIYPDRLPVDIRHNSKIFREQLAQWAVSG